jgi:hypothetical protein
MSILLILSKIDSNLCVLHVSSKRRERVRDGVFEFAFAKTPVLHHSNTPFLALWLPDLSLLKGQCDSVSYLSVVK